MSAFRDGGLDAGIEVKQVNVEGAGTWDPTIVSKSGAVGLLQLRPQCYPQLSYKSCATPKRTSEPG